MWQNGFEAVMSQIVVGHVKFILQDALKVLMPLLLLLNLLTSLTLLSVIWILDIDTHEYLILFIELHLSEILVVKPRAEIVVPKVFSFLALNVKISHHQLLLSLKLSN